MPPAFTWIVVIEDIKEKDVPSLQEFHQVGIAQIDFKKLSKTHRAQRQYKRIDFLDLLMHLWPGDWQAQLRYINSRIRASNKEKQNTLQEPYSSSRVWYIKEISEQEFCVFGGLIIVARTMG